MWSVQPKLFGGFHIFWIFAAFAFGYAGVLLGRRYKAGTNARQAKLILWIAEACFVALEIVKETYYAVENGGYRWDMFPLQICSILFFVLPVALLCRDGAVRDAALAFAGFGSLEGAIFYFFNPAAALTAPLVLLSVHSFFWHCLMIMTSLFVVVSFDLLQKSALRMIAGSYAVFLLFAVLAAVIDNITHLTVPELHIDYYHIGYEKVVYPLLNLLFKSPEPYLVFFFVFLVYFALGTAWIYYAVKGVCLLNRRIFKKDGGVAHEIG